MAGDLNAAIDQAMAICWDEGFGYNLGGMAQSHAAGVDCSGHYDIFEALNMEKTLDFDLVEVAHETSI